MLKLEALSAHFQALGIADHFAYNKTPLRPNRVYTITEIPGGFAELQEDLDNPYIQIRSRSEKNQAVDARDMAAAIDSIMLSLSAWPANLGGYHAVSAGRLGGPPAFLSTDDENRTSYVCNYFLKILR